MGMSSKAGGSRDRILGMGGAPSEHAISLKLEGSVSGVNSSLQRNYTKAQLPDKLF